MKNNYFILMLTFIQFSCTSVPTEMLNKPEIFIDLETNDIVLPIDYSRNVSETNLWTIGPIEERFKACDVSESIVGSMSTESLVRSIIDYPLNYLMIVYDNPQDAVDLIVSNSVLHRELIRRDNAAEKLISLYVITEISCADDEKADSERVFVSLSSALFLDAFLSSKWIAQIINNNWDELRRIVYSKIENRLLRPDLFSVSSIRPLFDICESYKFPIDSILKPVRSGGDIIGYTTLYTPKNHQPLQGIIRSELTDYEIESYNSQLCNAYPSAVMIAPSSARYNCHSYAWNDQSTSNAVWLNAYDSQNVFQLQKYWIDDHYTERITEANATRAYYSSADHSAIITGTNQYLSKWGSGPLMQHAQSYSPYSTNRMAYYCSWDDVEIEYGITINGDAQVQVNTFTEFSISHTNSRRTYVWTITYMNDPSMSDTFDLELITDRFPSTRYKLKCKQYGAYSIRVDEYEQDTHMAYGEKLVISMEL